MCNPVTVTPVSWADAEAQAALRSVRHEVFMREQGVPEELEWDDHDRDADHVIARDAFGNPIGCGRLLPDGHIGRVAVLRHWRGKGVGTELMNVLLQLARERGHSDVVLAAQVQAIPFYLRLGFVIEGDICLDANIPHRQMRLRLA